MIETLIILTILLAICIFFFKQAVTEFQILQTDSFEKVSPLLSEKCPIVVHPFLQSGLYSPQNIRQIPKLATLPLGKKKFLQYVDAPPQPTNFHIDDATSQHIASLAGLETWCRHTFPQYLKGKSLLSHLYTYETYAYIGSQGLRPTYASCTLLFPTHGTIHVSLLTEASDPFLPHDYKGKQVSSFDKNNTPLLEKIQYIDVILRQGDALVIPPHWKVCYKDDPANPTPSCSVWVEVHHPISKLVKKLQEYRKI